VIKRDPFEGLGTDERIRPKWVLKGRIQHCELDSPVEGNGCKPLGSKKGERFFG